MTLAVSTRFVDDKTIVSVSGDVDIATSPALREALNNAIDGPGRAIVVDLSAVEFIDSTGLGVLVGTFTAVRGSDRRMAIVADRPAVLRILRVTALDAVLGVHPTLDDATAALT